MWYVYILQSRKDHGFYIGMTSNTEERFKRHNAGYVISTKSRKPFNMVYVEEYISRSEAAQRERQIKLYKGGEAFQKLIKNV